jgi:DNA-binding Lrp family transcriptional regulator
MLTDKEKLLLRELQKNSRVSLTDVSKKTSIPISTLFETLKKLNQKVICKYTTLLDYNKIGYSIKVHFEITTKDKNKIKSFLDQSKHVNSAYSTLNGQDLYVECIFKELKELVEFKEQLEQFDVKEIKELFIVDEIAKENFSI